MITVAHGATALTDPFVHAFLTDRHDIAATDTRSAQASQRPQPLLLPIYITPLAPEQEQQRIIVISTPTWVRETIHDLHARGFAHANDWSSLLPSTNPAEAVSILTRRRQRQ